MSKQALILGGGSILGAFQAGEIRAVLERGYTPNIISGISVGSLNGAYITNQRAFHQWNEIGQMLWNFWLENITKPESVIVKRSNFKLLWQLITKRFNGLGDTQPIDSLIEKMVSVDNLMNSGVDFSVGAVNLNDSTITYAEPHMPNFKEYIKASKAIPIAMPAIKIGVRTYIDGGLIDSAPIGQAIKKGADEIIVCTPHPEKLKGAEINSGNLLEYANRIVSIMVNNTLNNDIKIATLINELCPKDGSPKKDEPFKGKKRIPIKVLRPDELIDVSLSNFKTKDIRMMLESGYNTANKLLNQ